MSVHVVLGATGGAGSAIATALRSAGIDIETVTRSGSGSRTADIETPEGAREAVRGAAAVYMAAQPPYTEWPERFPAMLANVIDACAENGSRLVMVDNLYGYGPTDSPLTERTPERAIDTKGKVRRRMTEMLLDAHSAGRVAVTIGRASDYFGPNAANSAITALSIEPASEGRKARWVGRLDMPHSVAYLPDIARAYVSLGTDDRSLGRVWHLPHSPALTGGAFIELVNRSLPEAVPVGVVSKTMLRLAAPFHGISRETLGIIHQWDRPFVVEDGDFRATFGPFEDTPLEVAVADTIRWYLEAGSRG